MSSQRHFKPWAFILPGLIAGTVILGVPIVQAFWSSLHQMRLYRLEQTIFIGFENYVRLWQDPLFLLPAQVTVIFTIGSALLSVVFGLASPACSARETSAGPAWRASSSPSSYAAADAPPSARGR